MTTFWYFFISFLAITIFVGGLIAAFRAGKEAGISKYDYIEDSENLADVSNKEGQGD